MPDLTYDEVDRLVDEDPIALRDIAWQLMRERDEARAEVEDRGKALAQYQLACGQHQAAAFEARARANEAARLSAEARDEAEDLRRTIADLREQIAIVDESREADRE